MKHLVFILSLVIMYSCSDNSTPDKKDSISSPVVFHPQDLRTAIAALENLHSRLIIEGKGDSLLDMYSGDPQIIQNGLTFYTGKQGVMDFWKMAEIYRTHTRTMIKLDGVENVLYETGIEAVSGTAKDGDQEFAGSSKYLVIWKKENGSWKMAVEMWNSLPASDPKDGD